jgi:HSP20 family molecular chaperone IbpA
MFNRDIEKELEIFGEMVRNTVASSLIKYDIKDKDTFFLLKFYTPGIKKDDLCLKMCQGRLSLVIEKEKSAQEIKVNTNMPQESAGNILAKYEDGVLTVTVPKTNHDARIIEIM